MSDWQTDPTQLRDYAMRCRENARREHEFAELCLAPKGRADHQANAARYERWARQAEIDLEALKL